MKTATSHLPFHLFDFRNMSSLFLKSFQSKVNIVFGSLKVYILVITYSVSGDGFSSITDCLKLFSHPSQC